MSVFQSEYLNEVYAKVVARDPNEPEFLQAVREVLGSLEPVIMKLSLIHIFGRGFSQERRAPSGFSARRQRASQMC